MKISWKRINEEHALTDFFKKNHTKCYKNSNNVELVDK